MHKIWSVNIFFTLLRTYNEFYLEFHFLICDHNLKKIINDVLLTRELYFDRMHRFFNGFVIFSI